MEEIKGVEKRSNVQISKRIISDFNFLSPNQRIEVLEEIEKDICLNCGFKHPTEMLCPCWNDD